MFDNSRSYCQDWLARIRSRDAASNVQKVAESSKIAEPCTTSPVESTFVKSVSELPPSEINTFLPSDISIAPTISFLPTRTLVFAAEQFPYAESSERRLTLKCAGKDANLMSRLLATDASNVRILSPDKRRATSENFREETQQIVDNVPYNSRVVLYFSTHCEKDAKGDYFLLTEDTKITYDQDGKVNSISNAISSTELASVIDSIKAKEIVLLSDACYSANFLQQLRAKCKYSFYALSSSNDEPSLVYKMNGVSIFTYYLSLAICLGDSNADGYVSFDEIFDFLSQRVKSCSYDEWMREAGYAFDDGVKSPSFRSSLDTTTSLQGMLGNIPAYQIPTKVVPEFNKTSLAFKAPKLSCSEAITYLGEGVAETLKSFRLTERPANVHEFMQVANKNNTDGVYANNPIGRYFASNLNERLRHIVDTSESFSEKSVAIREKTSVTPVSIHKESDIEISGTYLDLPNLGELRVRCEASTPSGTLASFICYVDRTQLEEYLLENDVKYESDEDQAIVAEASSVEPNVSLKNPRTAPCNILIKKKSDAELDFKEIYSDNKTQGAFSVKSGDTIQIGVSNTSDKTLGVVVLVDGLNVILQPNENIHNRFALLPAEHIKNKRYTIFKPNALHWWEGWQKYRSKSSPGQSSRGVDGEEFVIVDPPESYAGRLNAEESIGEIRILIYETYNGELPNRENDDLVVKGSIPNNDKKVGVGSGKAFVSSINESNFRIDPSAKPIAVVALKYYEKAE